MCIRDSSKRDRSVYVDAASRHVDQTTPDRHLALFIMYRQQVVENRQVLLERAKLHHAMMLPADSMRDKSTNHNVLTAFNFLADRT